MHLIWPVLFYSRLRVNKDIVILIDVLGVYFVR